MRKVPDKYRMSISVYFAEKRYFAKFNFLDGNTVPVYRYSKYWYTGTKNTGRLKVPERGGPPEAPAATAEAFPSLPSPQRPVTAPAKAPQACRPRSSSKQKHV